MAIVIYLPMLYIYLPGYSSKNSDELESISNALIDGGKKVLAYKWRHWTDENDKWDVEKDVEIIKNEIEKTGENEFVIVAKSLGTFVGVNLARELGDKVKMIIFMGIPTTSLDEDEKKEYVEVLKDANHPIFVVQNLEDPHGSPEDAKQVIGDVKYELLGTEGIEHRYNYPDLVLEVINKNLH